MSTPAPTIYSPDYIVFFLLSVIVVFVSIWQIPRQINNTHSLAFMYCDTAYVKYVEYSPSVQAVKITSTLHDENLTYHLIDNNSFDCPIILSNMASNDCRAMQTIDDWERVCEREEPIVYQEEMREDAEEITEEDMGIPMHPDISITSPKILTVVSSPLRVEGRARGVWFFEGDFLISIVDWDGRIIGEGYATARDEWMTEDFVSFEGQIPFVFDDLLPYGHGTIIFQKNNPSGMSELDDAYEIPILFREEEIPTTTKEIIYMEAL